MNNIAQNSALDIVSAAMEKTGYIGSPIGIEVNLADRHHRDHLNSLMTVAEIGIQEGAKRTTDDAITYERDDLNFMVGLATRTNHIRGSGTTSKVATVFALYAMMNPGQIVEAADTHNKDLAHSYVAELACLILQALKVSYRRVDNRSFVVTAKPFKN